MIDPHTTLIDEYVETSLNLPGMTQLRRDLAALSPDDWPSTFFMCYDIDHLRRINYSYGHPVGDRLLESIARWVVRRSGETLYRIGGDMFCVVLHDRSPEQARQFAANALSRSRRCWPLTVEGGKTLEVFVTASICLIPLDEGVLSQNLLDLFDRCLDDAKENKHIAVFSQEADQLTRERIRFQMDLKSCILKGMEGFSLCFQPIVDPTTTLWKGLEALCRWERPGHGPVSPASFIPTVEKLGLMNPMGEWVLKTAVDACAQLGLHQIPDFFLSVNVSACQISRPGFDAVVATYLAAKGFPPERLNLEITESSEVSFDGATRAVIDNLRRLGITLALDDFGTGYSSFSLLKNLPAQYVKTEREFVSGIDSNSNLQYSMYVISETAHLNGMRLICEGVETTEQLRSAVGNGADLVQGYYYSRPLDIQALAGLTYRFYRQGERPPVAQSATQLNFNQWLSSKEAYSITPSLFRLLYQCLDGLVNCNDLDDTINDILAQVGQSFKVSRAFVFLRDADGLFSNRYEWCAESVPPQRHLLQHMDFSPDGFDAVLDQEAVVITATESQLPSLTRQRLEAGGQASTVQASVVYPLKRKGRTLGFVGFDDACSRQWMPEEILLLHNLCLLLLFKLDI